MGQCPCCHKLAFYARGQKGDTRDRQALVRDAGMARLYMKPEESQKAVTISSPGFAEWALNKSIAFPIRAHNCSEVI